MMPQETLGAVIRARRLELGWSQEELASRSTQAGGEVRQSDISRLELGKVGLPRRARLIILADVLGIPVGALLARSGWAGYDDTDHVTVLSIAEPFAVRTTAVSAGEDRADGTAPCHAIPRDDRLARAMSTAAATRDESERLLQILHARWDATTRG